MDGNAQNATVIARNELLVVSGGAYQAVEGANFPMHQHNDWELVYYKSGHIRGNIGEDWYEIEPGVMLATPPETHHCEIALTGYSNFFIAIKAPVDQNWPAFAIDSPDAEMKRIFEAIVRECCTDSTESQEMLSLLIQQLDIVLRRAGARQRQPVSDQLAEQAARLIEERFSTGLQIQDLAQELNASPSALRRQFARVHGRSPMDYLQDVRVRHATDLLRGSTLTLDAVAALCGYDSASHLSRHIKNATGKRPGQLRAK